MPSWALGYAHVMAAAGRHAARPEGAADIEVGSLSQLECSQPPDLNLLFLSTMQDQDIGAGRRLQPLHGSACQPGVEERQPARQFLGPTDHHVAAAAE